MYLCSSGQQVAITWDQSVPRDNEYNVPGPTIQCSRNSRPRDCGTHVTKPERASHAILRRG